MTFVFKPQFKKTLLTFLFLQFVLALLSASHLLAASNREIKFVTFNIRNYDYDGRMGQQTDEVLLAKLIKETDADLIAVQEIRKGAQFKSFIRDHFPQYEVKLSDCGGAGHQKLGFVYNKEMLTLESFSQDTRLSLGKCFERLRPLAIGRFKVKSSSLSFSAYAVHLKAGHGKGEVEQRLIQYNLIDEILNEQKQKGYKNFILMGDFNTTYFKLKKSTYYRKFESFLENNDLRLEDTQKIQCTSYYRPSRYKDELVGSHLDHILISEELAQDLKYKSYSLYSHCAKLRCQSEDMDDIPMTYKTVSDHCPLQLKAKF